MSIKHTKNWLVWAVKSEPTSALTGKRAGWQRNLASYEEAREFIAMHPEYQLGYCFSADNSYIGIDLDACRDPDNGDIAGWAREIIDTLSPFACLVNTSVSGTGVKLIIKCDEPINRAVRFFAEEGHGDHVPQAEVFATSKYFALTCSGIVDDVPPPAPRQLLVELFGDAIVPKEKAQTEATSGDTSPQELKSLLSRLDVRDYPDRDGWIKLLMASHHGTGGSPEGKEVFREWSMGDEEGYNEADFERDWESQRLDAANPVTIGTLISRIPSEQRHDRDPSLDFEVVAVEEVPASTRVLPVLLDESRRNHLTISELFAEARGSVVKYVVEWSKWIVYSDGRWHVDNGGNRVHTELLDFLKSLPCRIPQGDGEQAAKSLAWINSLQNWNQTSGLNRQMRGVRGFAVTIEEMESDHDLLNFQNGTYDLESHEFRPHDPEDYCFHQCSTNYVEGKSCNLWVSVVNDIFGGDTELVRYVQRLFGYIASNDVSESVCSIFFGNGCNGKSTIVNCLATLLGDGYTSHIPSELFDANKAIHPTYIASLKDARFAVVSEMESNVHLAEAMIKKLTSEDKIEARRMREDPWSFTPTHSMVLCTNHKPKIKGSDTGIWRRLALVPFEVDLTAKQDRTIPARLEQELAGIANWIIEGHKAYVANGGLGSCEAVDRATDEYRTEEDEFAQSCEELFSRVQGVDTPVSDAFSAYVRSGGKYGRKLFCSEMSRIGHKRERKGGRNNRKYVYVNIKIDDSLGGF